MPFTPPPSANTRGDTDLFRLNTLYNREDPSFAFNNAMTELGYNPYRAANPYMDYLKRFAPGLTNAFVMDQAQRTGGPYGSPDQTANAAQYGSSDYRKFMMENLRSGNAYNTMSWGHRALPEMVQGVRNYADAVGTGGGNVAGLNPWWAELADKFGSNNGQGLVQAVQQSYTPFMTSRMAGAYSQGLGNAYQTAMRNFANDPNAINSDVYRYLLGY